MKTYQPRLFRLRTALSQTGPHRVPLVTVHTYAELRQYTAGQPATQIEVPAGTTIRGLLAQFGIPAERTRIVFIDGRAAKLDAVVCGGERIDLFSAIGGG